MALFNWEKLEKDYEGTFFPFFIQNRRIILITLLLILVIGSIAFLFAKCDNYLFQRGVDKDKKAVNEALQNINAINSQITNLKEQADQQVIIVNQAKENLNASKEETNEARENTNRFILETNKELENLRIIQNHDFNNTSFRDSNSARCDAFPDSKECRK